jgi:hypothetical protein
VEWHSQAQSCRLTAGFYCIDSDASNADPLQMLADNGMKIAATKLLLSHWKELVATTLDWSQVDATLAASLPAPEPSTPATPALTASASASSSSLSSAAAACSSSRPETSSSVNARASSKSQSSLVDVNAAAPNGVSTSTSDTEAVAAAKTLMQTKHKKELAALKAELQETKAMLVAKDRLAANKEEQFQRLQRSHNRLRLLSQCFYCISNPKYTRLELRVTAREAASGASPSSAAELVSYSAQEVVLKLIGWRAIKPIDTALVSSIVHSLRLCAVVCSITVVESMQCEFGCTDCLYTLNVRLCAAENQ